jgi:hypothetical protein
LTGNILDSNFAAFEGELFTAHAMIADAQAKWASALAAAVSERAMRDWLVISNCQTVGLTNCLSLLNPSVNMTGYDVRRLEHEGTDLTKEFYKYEHIFVLDSLYNDERFNFAAMGNAFPIPAVSFDAYHPDLCYVVVDDKIIKTPMDDYHSIICLAAFKKGLDEKSTRALFCRKTYEVGGYFDLWDAGEKLLCERFDAYGYDIRRLIRRWGLRDSFMMSTNHPKIRCLHDIARLATQKVGCRPQESDIVPHDNLCNAVAFPIYEEIAEHLGVPGSYAFKLGGRYRTIDLTQFIAGSFEEYRRHDPAKLETRGAFERRRAAIAKTL